MKFILFFSISITLSGLKIKIYKEFQKLLKILSLILNIDNIINNE